MPSPIAELYDLRHKVAIVTGAAAGIGAAIAERLAQAGACVAIADVDADVSARTAEHVRGLGAIARAFPCDVGRLDDIHRTVVSVVETLGRVDVLVNCAGVFPVAPALDVSEATWDRVFAVNAKGAFFLAQVASQQMIRQGTGGSIVTIASIEASMLADKLLPYEASQGALIAMTRALARELGPQRIRVNAVAPGIVPTSGAESALGAVSGGSPGELKARLASRTPLGRLGTPDDVARAALFLASSAADFVTGATLVVDGGLSSTW